jgi:hypothetical protein
MQQLVFIVIIRFIHCIFQDGLIKKALSSQQALEFGTQFLCMHLITKQARVRVTYYGGTTFAASRANPRVLVKEVA